MEDNQFEKRMELLKKSYERVRSSFDSEEVLRKIEEESKKPEPSTKKKAAFRQNVTVWVVSIASIFIIGILSATFLLPEMKEQALEGEITERYIEEIREEYKKEREKRREILQMDEETFASIEFVHSADGAFQYFLKNESYLENLAQLANGKERLDEMLADQISGLKLPSEMIEDLLNKPLYEDEEMSIEFLTIYSDKVKALIAVYNDTLQEGQEKNEEFMSMFDQMQRQNITYLESGDGEFMSVRYDVPSNNEIRDSLHEHTRGYYDMLIQEPYMVGASMNYSLEETIAHLQNMHYTLVHVEQDGRLYPVMATYFETLFYNVMKGNQYTTVFDEDGMVKEEYQDSWKSLASKGEAFEYLIRPIIEEMKASDWQQSTSWDAFDYNAIKNALVLAQNDKLEGVAIDDDFLQRVYELYENFAESKDQSMLVDVDPIEIVGLYFYTGELGDYETQYELYLQDNQYMAIDKEEHLEFSEKHPVSEGNKMSELYKGISFEVKVDVDGTTQGIAKLFGKPGKFSEEEEKWRHFSMMKNEFGWRVHFMPMQ